MCKFFSVVTRGDGIPFFFDAKLRQEFKENNPKNYEFDSHTSIADHFNLFEDKLNKYEYCPITKNFTIDQINNKKDDSKIVKKWYEKYDFSDMLINGIYNIDLSSLTTAEGLKLPDSIGGYLDLRSLTTAEGLKLPDSIGGSLYLGSLTTAEGLKLPDSIGGSLDLASLTTAEKNKLIEKYPKFNII